MKRRTFLDSCTLIAAFQGKPEISDRVFEILDDPNREFVVSRFLALELIPKPTFNRRQEEIAFMNDYLRNSGTNVESSEHVVIQALELAGKYDLHPVDALHASCCVEARVDDFLTTEKDTKPLFRIKLFNIKSLLNPSN